VNETPPDRNLLGAWTPVIFVVVLAAVGVGVFALVRATGRDRKPADLPDAFVYDVSRYRTIPPERIGYRQVAKIDTGLKRATALAVGPADEILVGGDRKVLVHAPDGSLRETVPTEETPLALTTSREGDLYVAHQNMVAGGMLGGPVAWLLTIPGDKARVTSIAVSRDALYVADAGARGVWRFARDGKPRGRIGDRNPDRGIPGFNVPSPYFDLLVAADGLLRIVDPGRHKITAFTEEGDLEFSWGKPTLEIEGFGGCCNPSHIAQLPDGRFVTSEKGIPRVKVHDADGSFVTAVVGADGLSTETEPCDVAADSEGRILVLDPGAGAVRVFEALGGPAHED
jgi:glucose/arabinose dehydrogenase